jgi:hypothetical protein
LSIKEYKRSLKIKNNLYNIKKQKITYFNGNKLINKNILNNKIKQLKIIIKQKKLKSNIKNRNFKLNSRIFIINKFI